jgi:pimeloyl-ACP methyl ester carboxylesterase
MAMIRKASFITAIFLFVLATVGFARAAEETKAAESNDHFVTVYGTQIHYIDEGKGPVVIFLHGLGDNTGIWEATLPALRSKYRVIAYDHPGFGKSGRPMLAYRMGTLVDFLGGFMKAMNIDKATLVGNSLGGWAAVNFTAQNPQKVERLVLLDSAGYAAWPSPEVGNALRLATREDIAKLLPLTFHDQKTFGTAAVIDQMFTEHVAANDGFTIVQLLDSFARGEDVIDQTAKNIKVPTLIVWGRYDRLIPLANGERLHRDIRHSKFHIIENCGHMAEIECPDVFNGLLLSFLSGSASGNPPLR